MTYLVIGYPDSRAKGDPQVLYCGASRRDARDILQAGRPGLTRAHLFVDPLPSQIKRYPVAGASGSSPKVAGASGSSQPEAKAPEAPPAEEKPLTLPAKKRSASKEG